MSARPARAPRVAAARGLAATAAGALLASALATPCSGQLLPVGAPALGLGSPPSFVTERIAWRGPGAATLAEAPLSVLREGPAYVVESEWAPLFRGRDGSRLEQAQHHVRAGGVAGPFTLGADLRRETIAFRGGDGTWGFDAGGVPLRSGTLGAALASRRFAGALAGTFGPDGRAGVAVESGVALAPGWRASLRASNVPRTGALDVRWEDYSVASRGSWNERWVTAGVDVESGPDHVSGALESFNRRTLHDAARYDRFRPVLSWRGARGEWTRALAGARLRAGVRHGEGRQRLEVSRGSQPYAVAAGPVREDALTLGAGPRSGRWETRAWIGRSHASASGSLALWPFDGLAAVGGTRYVASSDFSFRHIGLAMDGRPAASRGWDGGLALWALDPLGHYESWRATLFGLGRDDYDQSAMRLKRTLLAGARVARSQPIGSLTMRLEVVQWAPVWVKREGSVDQGAPGPPPGDDAAAPHEKSHGRTWGGTLVRLALSAR